MAVIEYNIEIWLISASMLKFLKNSGVGNRN